MSALLEVDDLHVSFRAGGRKAGRRRLHVLDGVSLAVAPGEVVGIIGESGAGKSTLGRAALGLVRPDRGAVRFGGLDVTAAGRRELRAARRGMHLIFQDPYDSLSPRLRVEQSVAEPLVIHGVPDAEHGPRVEAALVAAGLAPPAEFARRFPGEMSGGQRQRVALARALVLEPRLIVADEPTSMLDVSLRAGLLRTMSARRDEQGIAFLFITHDLALARSFCDRIAVMFRGTFVEVGPSEQVLAAPRHPYTQALRAAVRDPAAPPAAATHGLTGGCIYRHRCPRAEADLCAAAPALLDVGPGHAAACHLAEPAGSEPAGGRHRP